MREKKAKALFFCGSLVSVAVVVIVTVLVLGKSVRFEYKRPDFARISEYIDELDTSMTSVDVEEYRKRYGELNEMLTEVFTESRILMINMNNDVTSGELLAEYEEFYSDYSRLYRRYAEYLNRLMQEGVYDRLAENRSEEERISDLDCLNILNDDYAECLIRQKELVKDYYAERAEGHVLIDGNSFLLSDIVDSESYSTEEKTEYVKDAYKLYYDHVKDIYLKIIANNKRMAASVGYDSYYSYIEKVSFHRSPGENTKRSIREWIKDTVVPLYIELFNDLSMDEVNALVKQQYDSESVKDTIEKGLASLSDSCKDKFCKLDERGLLQFDDAKGRSKSNYTTYLFSYGVPYVSVYRTGFYTDISGMLHEFGHAYGYEVSGANIETNMDVFEALAQSMNGIFWADRFHSRGADTEIRVNTLNILQMAVLSAVYDEFEERVYAANVRSAAELDNMFCEIVNSYGLGSDSGMGVGNWSDNMLLFENPFYYSHYLYSSVPALIIFSQAMEDMDRAKTMLFDELIDCANCDIAETIERLSGIRDDDLSVCLRQVANNIKKYLQYG